MEDSKPIFSAHDATEHGKVAAYSPGIEPRVAGHEVHFSGIVGRDPSTGKIAEGGAGPETECIFDEIERLLAAARLSIRNIISVLIFIAGPVSTSPGVPSPNFQKVNTVYNRRIAQNNPPPSRATIGNAELLDGANVEMIFTAFRPDGND